MADKRSSKLHHIWCFTHYNLYKLCSSPKPYIILVALSLRIIWLSSFIRDYLIQMRRAINFLEYYILLSSDNNFYFFLMIGLVLLISDCPFVPEGTGYYLLRSNRHSWFWGQVIYIFMIAILVNLFLLLVTAITLIPHVTLGASWSPIILQGSYLANNSSFWTFSMSSFGLLSVYMSLPMTFILSFSVSVLWMTALGTLSLGVALYTATKLGSFVVGGFIILARLVEEIPYAPAALLNPINLVYLSRWVERWRDGMGFGTNPYVTGYSLKYAVCFFLVMFLLSCLLGFHWAKKYDFAQ